MIRIILLGTSILVVTACGKTEKPEGILTEKQMVNIMTELYLAEEKVNKLSIPYDSVREIFPLFSERAFNKTKISDSIFRKSLDYYMSEPEKMEDIYTTLVDSLNLKAQRAGAHKKEDAVSN